MYEFIIVYDDDTNRTISAENIASIVYMIDDIDWNKVVAIFRVA